MSGRTLDKAEEVVAATEENPAEHQDLVEKMDRSPTHTASAHSTPSNT